MWLKSESFENGDALGEKYAMGKHDPETHATFADNKNPHLAWGDLPAGTKSLALVMVDSQAPTVPDDVNQEGRSVPADLPRADFFHWSVINIDPALNEIGEGTQADGVVPTGKDDSVVIEGTRHGLNSYTQWFEGDDEMGGDYFGYDGPFPPWNDERTHEYAFTVYALDVDVLDLPDAFDAQAVLAAIEGHVLESATINATYRINPN